LCDRGDVDSKVIGHSASLNYLTHSVAAFGCMRNNPRASKVRPIAEEFFELLYDIMGAGGFSANRVRGS
jgi:hypothetical protein